MRHFTWAVTLATSAITLALLGCNGKGEGSGPVSFVTKDAPIEFSFPAGWFVNPKDNPYDLHCFSPREDLVTGVFASEKVNLAADATPTDIFWAQIKDLKSRRRNVEELEALRTQEYDDKTVTSITYLGDKDSNRNCYTFSLIEFRADNSKFAVVIQTAFPEDWKTSKPVLEAITRSARPLPDRD
jgi:hypothetical protein